MELIFFFFVIFSFVFAKQWLLEQVVESLWRRVLIVDIIGIDGSEDLRISIDSKFAV